MPPVYSSLSNFSQIQTLALDVQPAGFICGNEGGHLYHIHYNVDGAASRKLLARPLYSPAVARPAPDAAAAPTAVGGLGGYLGGYLGGWGGYLGLGGAAPADAAMEPAASAGATDERLLGVQGLGIGHVGPNKGRLDQA
jgi:hypothetical protein